MKLISFLLLWFIFILFLVPGYSATKYVTDHIEVMVRTGPGMDHKIIAMPTSGTRLEVLEELGNGWSKVRLLDNREGWVVARYLSEGPSAARSASDLKNENEGLKQQIEILNEENARLQQEKDDLQSALSEQTKTAQALEATYERLRAEDPEFLALKSSHQKVSERLTTSARREAELEEKLQELESGDYFRWFLTGAGTLLVGLLIGFMMRRARRRPSLL
jgi:SH3 domain protein